MVINHISRSNCRGDLSGAGVACFGHGDNCNRPKELDLMLGAGVGMQPQYRGSGVEALGFPSGFAWDQIRFPMGVKRMELDFAPTLSPGDLVDPQISTGTAVHVCSATGEDSNNGLGTYDGDFSAPKRTIHGAFATGNATGGAYSVLVKAELYKERAFTRNGKNEPNQPVAIVDWGGAVRY